MKIKSESKLHAVKWVAIVEILVAIGIIAVVASIYFKVGVPIIENKTEENVDNTRKEQVDKLNSWVNSYHESSNVSKSKSEKKVYVSLPSNDELCKIFNLPTLPDGWTYACKNKDNYQKTDGNGWLPLNFNQIKDFKEMALPIDPVNAFEGLFYFTYMESGDDWVITAKLKNRDQIRGIAWDDGGYDKARYEVGSNVKIWGEILGIVGYWPFDEGSGVVSADASGNKHSAVLSGDASWLNKANCMLGMCLNVDNNNRSITITPAYSFTKNMKGSYSFWFKIASDPVAMNTSLFIPGSDRLDFIIEKKTNNVFVWFKDSKGEGKLVYKARSASITDNKWHFLVVSKDIDNINVYIDSINVGGIKTSLGTEKDTDAIIIGDKNISKESSYITYSVDEVTMYNRSLDSSEIEQMYNAIK